MFDSRTNRFCFWLILLALLSAGMSARAQAAVLVLEEAEAVARAGGDIPADDAGWTRQALPDTWSSSRPGTGGDVWYRLHFTLAQAPREEQAVYLPRLCMNAAVYLNGVFLGDGGSFDEPVGRNWNRPLLFLAPPALLHAGDNTLHIRLNSPPFSLGNLSPVQFGALSELRPEFERLFFWRITLNQTATLIIAAMGLFMLALWWRRRQDSMFGYFGLSALVWAFNASNLFVRDLPIAARLWETLIQASFQVFISLLLISLLRFLGLRQPPLERVLWLILFASPLSLMAAPAPWLPPIALFWHLLTMLVSVWVLAYLIRATARKPQADALLLLAALGINLLFGIHDWLKQSALLHSGDTHWLHFGGPLFFLVVGGIMTNRFVLALNQYERLSAELEQRVRDNRSELQKQFEHVQEIEKQKAAMVERERIFRDLHDDMGAKLLGLTISAQRANLPREADLARSALQDLRDVVSRSAQTATPLEDLLADWRAENEQRVRAAGLVLEWHFPERECALAVSPEAALHMSRILREAVSNVLRHAHASHLCIRTQIDDTDFGIRIEDDGCGLPEHAAPHRGMSGMQARAAAMGATLQWQTAEQGCRVLFRVPLQKL